MARPDSYETPPGIAIHPWINKPDTKFNADGVFHTKIVFDDTPELQTLLAKVREKAQERFNELLKDLTPGERKKWKVYAPIENEEDEETGEPTGRIIVGFKRNHTVKVDGEQRQLRVYLYDSLGNDIPVDDEPAIFGGTELKVMFTMRDVKVPGTKNAGVKLDFYAVQIIKLAEGRGRSPFSKANVNSDDEAAEHDGYVFRKDSPKAAGRTASTDADNGDDSAGEY